MKVPDLYAAIYSPFWKFVPKDIQKLTLGLLAVCNEAKDFLEAAEEGSLTPKHHLQLTRSLEEIGCFSEKDSPRSKKK